MGTYIGKDNLLVDKRSVGVHSVELKVLLELELHPGEDGHHL